MVDQEKVEEIRSQLTLQYIAGFFDGEGSITVTNALSLQVIIGQNDESILHAISQFFGTGKVSAVKIRRGHKQSYTVRWCGFNAARVLEQLKPFLILKRDRAELAVKMQALVSPRGVEKPIHPEKRVAREQYAEQIKGLNDSHWSRRPSSEGVTKGVN